MIFMDRRDAGRQLAVRLMHFEDAQPVVLGLPRGGVPVAAEVADALGAPLDVCLVRKLGVPLRPELGMGAIGEGGVRVINDDVVRAAGVTADELAQVESRERQVLAVRSRRYRGGRRPARVEGRTVLLIDDGVATGSTARAACAIARSRGAARVVLGLPVGPPDVAERLRGAADELVCLHTPRDFLGVGQFYADFSQTGDDEVVACLDDALIPPTRGGRRGASDPAVPDGKPLDLPIGSAEALRGELTVPENAIGIVIFAHGSGSSRHSPRNRAVAAGLNRAGLGTLLFDLLTEQEAAERGNVFDTALLATRLAMVTRRIAAQPEAVELPVGYFGASTGAAAALRAAAEPSTRIAAVVSRGGRPDLAALRLPSVTAPTLLIVGGDDPVVLRLNREALDRLQCECRLAVVPGAGHLFVEPGSLQQVTVLARDWFTVHMSPATHAPTRV